MGCRSIACLNARRSQPARLPARPAHRGGLRRRRVPLRLRRPTRDSVRRSDDLTVRSMIAMARDVRRGRPDAHPHRCLLRPRRRAGMEVRRRRLVRAGLASTSTSSSTWRAGIEFDGAVYAGVMASPTASMARKVSADVPQLAVPGPILARLDAIRCRHRSRVELVLGVRESSVFDGAHLIPVNRYRQVAARLEVRLARG